MIPAVNLSSICTKSYTESIGQNLTTCLHFSITLVTREITHLVKNSTNPFSSWVDVLFRVATLTLTSFALLALLPISLSLYFAGRIVLFFSPLKINNGALKRVPEPLYIPNLDGVSTKTILDDCRSLLPDSVSAIERMLTYPNNEYQRSLQGIAYKFNELDEEGNNFLSPQLKIDILKRLVDVNGRCVETWMRVASTIFLEIFTNANNIEQTILCLVLNYKDQIALNLAQNRLNLEWHFVSGLKQVIGDEIGLPATEADLGDAYGGRSIPYLKSLKFLALYHFLHPYKNGNALVVAITTSLHLAPNKKQIYDFLFRELSDPETFIPRDDFSDFADYQIVGGAREIVIKEKGAVYLLKKFGVLL
jgi:hypothetical protein